MEYFVDMYDDAVSFSSIRIQLKRNSSKTLRGRETERVREENQEGTVEERFLILRNNLSLC